jgi:hypothetical protein
MNKSCYALVFVVLMLATGCDNNVGYLPIYEIVDRYVIAGISKPEDLPGTAPFAVQFEIEVSIDDPDEYKDRPVSKAEIDFGDGSGFVDVTSKLVRSEWIFNYTGEHTYFQAGAYILRARATYWDGAILEYTLEVPIVVLPPDDDGGGA